MQHHPLTVRIICEESIAQPSHFQLKALPHVLLRDSAVLRLRDLTMRGQLVWVEPVQNRRARVECPSASVT